MPRADPQVPGGTIVDELASLLERRLRSLASSRKTHLEYLSMKMGAEDWHGVADAANDLREIDAEARAIAYAHRGGRDA